MEDPHGKPSGRSPCPEETGDRAEREDRHRDADRGRWVGGRRNDDGTEDRRDGRRREDRLRVEDSHAEGRPGRHRPEADRHDRARQDQDRRDRDVAATDR
jgi:hypothetical protein